MTNFARPARVALAPGLEISRIVTGLWQVADMERGGHLMDPVKGAADMAAYADRLVHFIDGRIDRDCANPLAVSAAT